MILWVLIGLVVSSLHIGTDYIFYQWMSGLVISLIPVFFWLKKKTSPLFAFNFCALSAYCFYVIFSSFSVYAKLPPGTRLGYSLASAMSYVSYSIPLIGLLLAPKKLLTAVIDALPILAVINSLYVIVTWALDIKFVNSMGYSGFLDYSGINGVFIAICIIPSIKALFENPKNRFAIVSVVLSLLALILSKGSILWGVLACGIGATAITRIKDTKSALKFAAIAAVPLLIAVVSEGSNVLDSGKRFEAYQIFLSGWWNSDPMTRAFGFGPGAFQIISKTLQQQAGFMIGADGKGWIWLWLHADYLQALMEYGIIGLILTLSLLFEVLIKLYRQNDKTAFAIAIGVVSSAIFDYPCRLWPLAFLVMWCIVFAYRGEETVST